MEKDRKERENMTRNMYGNIRMLYRVYENIDKGTARERRGRERKNEHVMDR